MWLEITTADLCAPRRGGLRRFMTAFSIEMANGREDFLPLASVYVLALKVKQGEETIAELIKSVVELFPSPKEGTRLKTQFFGNNRTAKEHSAILLSLPEARVLESLTTTKYHDSFDPEALSISDRASALTASDFESAKNIAYSLLKNELTPMGGKFIDGLCEGILSNKEFDLPYDHIELVFQLIKHEPKLATMPQTWRGDEDYQHRIFQHIISNFKPSSEDISNIIEAMLDAGSDVVAAGVSFEYLQITIETILAWCNSKSLREVLSIGTEWKRVLADHPGLCIKWLRSDSDSTDETKILLAIILDPNSYPVIRGGAALWVEFSKNAGSLVEGNELISVMTFLLALGFNDSGHEAVSLVRNSFEEVYLAAEGNYLNDANWHLLASHAPTITWGADWDKCERLRGALVEHFVSHNWPHEDFLYCLRNTRLFESVIAQVTSKGIWFNRQRKYLIKIAEQVSDGKLNATGAQSQLLEANFSGK
jgi:hypothetical protein